MSVDSQHEDYTNSLARWRLVRDCVKGQDAIKSKKEIYLPKPNPSDTTPENNARYYQYIQRANFVNVTGRTCNSLKGAMFRKPASFDLPEQVQYMEFDANGGGLTLQQLAKLQTQNILVTGRSGMLIDYPSSVEGASLEDTINVRASISTYPAETILNWTTEKVNGQTILTQVVLQESVNINIDRFNSITEKRYRVLYLERGVYYQDVYDESHNLVQSKIRPRKANGESWKEVPFIFVGSEENNPDVDMSPLYDLAQINIGHYRNSADYEEGIFIHGQGTLFISSEQSNEAFAQANPNGILVGARSGHFLGPNGSAQLVQMEANAAAREAMIDKQEQMVSIGARLITSTAPNQTAEAARIASSSETSVLSTISDNVSSAITQALKYACEFMGANPELVKYQLNKDFFDSKIDPQLVMALIQLADRGDIAKSDIRHSLRRADFFKDGRTDDDIDDEAEVSIL